MKKIIYLVCLLSYPVVSLSAESLTFGVVPQQSASKLARLWSPILKQISNDTGIQIQFATAPNIPVFEKRLLEGHYDIAYMNPYHYVVYNKHPGYTAINKARDKKIKGILVTRRDSSVNSLTDLTNSTLAFPAPAAFAATILTKADLKSHGAKFTPKYVSSHDSVYRAIAKGIYPAGGGVVRTFKNMDPTIREQLKILWTTKGYTPHAIAVHPRLSTEKKLKIQSAFSALENHTQGALLLQSIKIKGFVNAVNNEWNDVRELGIQLISN